MHLLIHLKFFGYILAMDTHLARLKSPVCDDWKYDAQDVHEEQKDDNIEDTYRQTAILFQA